ncbi:type II toxin-antitoxin system PemK/MazF family toxin [Candidatus Poribacteria bacterium]|nr:type II toxin-antitoxin system PemK/MazF family toxin [Candidatus Poribacteria bacterium]
MRRRPWIPQRGEVVLVRFPFLQTDGRVRVKPRPAVIISGPVIHEQTADVIIAAISSRPASRPLPTDYHIPYGSSESKAGGLKRDSWVKVSNLATIPRSAIARRLGRLTAAGMRAVDERLRLALGLD